MPSRKRARYRVVAVSLYEEEASEADRLTDVLKRAGWPKANRSFIVREALMLLEQDLAGQDDEAVFRYFVDCSARRLGRARASHAASGGTRSDPDAPTERPRRDPLGFPDRK